MREHSSRLVQAELAALAVRWRAATPLTRRQLLAGFLSAAGTLVATTAVGRTVQDACLLTPPQTEGPFHPVCDQPEKDNDLTRLKGASGRAAGQVLYISGQVRDRACRPVAGALVEIWQANAYGRYNHPDDDNTRAHPSIRISSTGGSTRPTGRGATGSKPCSPPPIPLASSGPAPPTSTSRCTGAGSPT